MDEIACRIWVEDEVAEALDDADAVHFYGHGGGIRAAICVTDEGEGSGSVGRAPGDVKLRIIRLPSNHCPVRNRERSAVEPLVVQYVVGRVRTVDRICRTDQYRWRWRYEERNGVDEAFATVAADGHGIHHVLCENHGVRARLQGICSVEGEGLVAAAHDRASGDRVCVAVAVEELYLDPVEVGAGWEHRRGCSYQYVFGAVASCGTRCTYVSRGRGWCCHNIEQNFAFCHPHDFEGAGGVF